MVDESSRTDNPDTKVTVGKAPVQNEAPSVAATLGIATPKASPSQTTNQPVAGREPKLEPPAATVTKPRDETSLEKTPGQPPRQPPHQEKRIADATPGPNYSGVLVEKEIRDLNLVRVHEASRQDERCYQPTSYDLRLGAEYVTPSLDGQLVIHRCDGNGMVTIAPFATAIVSTYESVALPNNVVGRFNLRIQHALEGLIVQMGTQVEPQYEGPLIALLHNISDHPKTLKFRDYDTRPFTIEFSYTSQPAAAPDPRKKQRKAFSDFIPPNYARGGVDLVLRNLNNALQENTRLARELNSTRMLWFTGIFLIIIVTAATIFIPLALAKFTYDKNSFPIVNADAVATMKYGPNHSNNAEIVNEVIKQLDSRRHGEPTISREEFYAEELARLKARRDAVKGDPAELKSIEKQIDEIVDLLKK